MGTVYKGTWKGLPSALKILANQNWSDTWKENFKYEIYELCKLKFPHIVQIYGAILEQNNIGILMEHVPKNLAEVIFTDHKKFPEVKKKNIIMHIAHGLEYLHNKGIVHCNLECSNVLLDEHNIAKITKYGPKCSRFESQSSCNLIGHVNPHYAAPEILRKDQLATEQLTKSDMYSLAIVMYEVLEEKKAYGDFTAKQLEAEVGCNSLRPTLQDTSLTPSVVDIMTKCWNGSINVRITPSEFVIEWKKIKHIFGN